MIAGAGTLDENVKVQIGYIRDAAKRLTEMVDDLVADAMADALDITIRREPVDIVGPGPGGRGGEPAAGRAQGADDRRWSRRPIMPPCAMPTGSARRSTISSATPSNTARSAARSTSW